MGGCPYYFKWAVGRSRGRRPVPFEGEDRYHVASSTASVLIFISVLKMTVSDLDTMTDEFNDSAPNLLEVQTSSKP